MLKQVTSIQDYQLIMTYLSRVPYEDSILNIGNIVQWNTVYPIYYEEDPHHHYLIMMSKRTSDEAWTAYVPLCEPCYYEQAINRLREHFDELGQTLQMKWIPLEVLDLVRPYFCPIHQEFSNDDESDYIYEAEQHRTMAGKKMQKKRNHINSFLNEFDGRHEFKVLTPDHTPEIVKYLDLWKQHKPSNPLLDHEMLGIPAMLKAWEAIDLRVGALYLDHHMIGFALVTESSRGCVQINVEKGEGDIRGAYPYLQQLTLQHLAPHARSVNREDDGGIDYLRKAKQSMHPSKMMQKWTLKECSGRQFSGL